MSLLNCDVRFLESSLNLLHSFFRHIGVSNFRYEEIVALEKATGVFPSGIFSVSYFCAKRTFSASYGLSPRMIYAACCFTESSMICTFKRINLNYIKLLVRQKFYLSTLPILVAQLEINPFNQQSKLVKNLTSLGIAIQAYSVLTNGQKLNDQRLIKIAKSYDATAAQTMIQWCLQKGYSCVTKSTKQQHLEDNINLGEFHLEDEDMKV